MLITGNKQSFTRDEIATASPLAGFYVLYAGEEIVFIGCATLTDPDGIRGRLAEHLHREHGPDMNDLTHWQRVTGSFPNESQKSLLWEYMDEHGELPRYNTLADSL